MERLNAAVRAPRRWVAAVAACASAIALVLGAGAAGSAAQADTAPAAGIPPTVASDGLPTWQINGVVWSQAIVGNTVYVAGNFTKARPAGVAVGGAGEVTASYAFAYDITTGNRVASFAPVLDAQANVVTASPDGKTVYFGGDFSSVNGFARAHIAAFSTATNALVTTFAPSVNARVAAIAVSSTAVYAGGSFTTVNGATRSYLAAFSPTNGALLPWAPVADQPALSMVVSPDRTRVIAGGRFTTLNGTAAYGMGSLDATSGATLAWAAQNKIRDAGVNGGITTLRTDGTNIIGGGYSFGTGAAWEGVFAANPTTGAIVYANDCHGDTYDVFPMGQVVYQVSHVHSCEWIGSFKNTQPFTNHFATAYTNYATTTNTGPDDYGWNFNGTPAGSLLDWFPTLTPGTFTGQNQAGWSVTGNSTYVAYGGEFTYVNGVAQQGLVRFAVPTTSPDKIGVTSSSLLVPGVQSLAAGSVRVSWPAGVDRDNLTLTYRLYRDAVATPIYTTTVNSTFWNVPGLSFVDTGLAPGSTHTYYVRVTDPNNNAKSGPTSAPVTVASGPRNAYVSAVLADGATHYWRLDETSGTQLVDWAGATPLFAGATVGRGAAGAINGDSDGAVTVDGTATGMAAMSYGQLTDAPATFSVEAWVKTTSTWGGEIVGFGNLQGGNSTTYDRRLYMDSAGHVVFGVVGANGTKYTVVSPSTYRNGAYHHLVGTFSSAGMALYVDGSRVGTNTNVTSAKAYQGYWRIGQDNMAGWSPQPGSSAFVGTIDEVAVYGGALTSTQVAAHHSDALAAPSNVPPVARIATPTCTGTTCTFDGSASSDSDGTVASYSWNFGDGGTATGAKPSHTYAANGVYTVTLVVTDNKGATGSTTVTAAPGTQFAVDTFTRTVTGGWGTADVGGAWTTTSGSAFAVDGATGTLTMGAAGSGPSIYLASVAKTSSDTYVNVTTNKAPTGSGVYATVIGRRIAGTGDYRAKVRLQSTGVVGVTLSYVNGAGTETTLKSETTVAGLTYTTGSSLRIRLQVTGTSPTTVQAKVWLASGTEPTAWAATVTDATAAMQAAGGVGLAGYLSSSSTNAPLVESWDNLRSGPVGG